MKVGAFTAKTNFSQLLERVRENNEEILITRRGEPVAKLTPIKQFFNPQETINKIRKFRRGKYLGKNSIKSMVMEGRR